MLPPSGVGEKGWILINICVISKFRKQLSFSFTYFPYSILTEQGRAHWRRNASDPQGRTKSPTYVTSETPVGIHFKGSCSWDCLLLAQLYSLHLMSAAAPTIRQSAKQTTPMKRVLLPEVLGRDSEMVRVHVLPTGFTINPKAPRSAARPDGGLPHKSLLTGIWSS